MASSLQQQQQMEIKQFKDFLSSYNQLTERCFLDCVKDFTSRKVLDSEKSCSNRCMDKYLKMTQRISQRFQEYQIQQNEGLIAAQQKSLLR
ncbi:mitochondrial import inner membrane translocase subunit Tim9-like [Anneissia japonica]|uniref:mitochondrial import inner membrane translocase subunit Tim9-like n=1 Tax=Anneissia japonica TaxID=1529436 RepID=UPI00142563C1|nr:mitochondrial import inner membrane translocase subunit Tim9-like [Anneissia japonica]